MANVVATRLWPGETDAAIPHAHPGLALDHPTCATGPAPAHAHLIVIDALHPTWP